MDGVELFETIKQNSSVIKILNIVKNHSKRGYLYEKLWSVIIKFGFCTKFPNDEYVHYDGNINTCNIHVVEDLEMFLKNMTVFGKGDGGSSDITLRHKDSGKWIFISCKYYLDDATKSIKDYDISDIIANAERCRYMYDNYDIYLIVNDSVEVKRIIDNVQETSKNIKECVTDVFGIKDLTSYFRRFMKAIRDVSIDEINDNFYISKEQIRLRFHQQLIVSKMMKKIDDDAKHLLIAAKPRSGKTYCVGGLAIEFNNKYNKLNVLVITPAPTETISQFTNDMFCKFRDFDNINIVEIHSGNDLSDLKLQEKNVIIVSKQLIDDYVLERRVEAIYSLKLDLIVFDENHFHGTTDMSENIINSYTSDNTVKVFLTATYSKPLQKWNMQEDCCFYWDIDDERLCKERNIDILVEKHGDIVRTLINDDNIEEMLSVYDTMPTIHMITNLMDSDRYLTIKDKIKDTSYGFSMSTLLCGEFPKEVDKMLRYMTGSNKEKDFVDGDKSIFRRIVKQSIKSKSRTLLNNNNFTSQLWFLPYGVGMTIDAVSEHLKSRMIMNKVLKLYEIMIVNSKDGYKLRDIKNEIAVNEIKAKADGKDGLIILAGNQLSLGVTLPLVDIVILMNDTMSCDRIVQMMYRCMTETIKNDVNDGIKKMGFVVDMNISRVLNTLISYNIYKTDLNTEQKLQYIIYNDLINIDGDLFKNKENKTDLIERLLNIWKTNPVNNLKTLLKHIEDIVVSVDTYDQRRLNAYFIHSLGDREAKITCKVDTDVDQQLETGRTIHKVAEYVEDVENVEEDVDDVVDIKKPDISLEKDILPFVIPLSCILTMKYDTNDFLDMLKMIQNDQTLLDVFDDQSYIWWNRRGILKMITEIIEKYIRRDTVIYNIAIQFKTSLKSMVDRPQELLELINECLKPKKKEKQAFGEVFTPMVLINEMLDNLDKFYKDKNGCSIFTEASFKWGDVLGCGMGNFSIAVYMQLMKGLEPQFPDEKARKRHIIDNMLYMAELNKKNVLTCKQIFDIDNKYNIHIYTGDALELDPFVEWGVEHFDVVMGNPPYNKGGIKSCSGALLGDKNETVWPVFVEKALNMLKPNGYLVAITPLSWLRNGHDVHELILRNYIIHMKLWDSMKSRATIKGEIPISLYVLQNSINTMKMKTTIISEIRRDELVTSADVYLDKSYSVPLALHSIFNKLLQFINSNKLQLDVCTKMVKSIGKKQKIPEVYNLEDMWAVDTYLIDNGIMVKKTVKQHPDADKRKLIIANKIRFVGVFIDDGRLGLTSGDKFYILGEKLELLLKLLSFDIMNMVGHLTKYRQHFLDREAFTYIPDIRKLDIDDIDEDTFYKMLKLTKQEIEVIEKFHQ